VQEVFKIAWERFVTALRTERGLSEAASLLYLAAQSDEVTLGPELFAGLLPPECQLMVLSLAASVQLATSQPGPERDLWVHRLQQAPAAV
jgi:hypothetical protein